MSSSAAAAPVALGKTLGRKKKYRSKTPKSMKGKVAKLSKTVSSIKKELSSAIEVKNFDTSLTVNTPVDNLGTFLANIFNPAQGVGNGARVGDQVDPISINMRYRVAQNVLIAVPTTGQHTLRVILFWDHENNMVSTDLLDVFTLGGALATFSNYPRASRGAFTVIYDKVHTLDIVENNQEFVNINLKLNKSVRFAPGAATTERNQLRCFVVSNETLASGNQRPTFQMNCRVWYKDA